LSQRLSSWLQQLRTVGDYLDFFDVTVVNIFSSVNKIILTLLDNHFSATVSNGSSRHSSLEHDHFEHKHFTR